MVCTVLLVGLLIVTTVTDVGWREIHNWTTYPGIIIALLISGLATCFGIDVISGTESEVTTYGIVPFTDSLFGFLSCGMLMLICYVFFPGGVGGGDVKLIAMIGAFRGVLSGLATRLWIFVLGGCMALIMLVWRYGIPKLIARTANVMWLVLRSGGKLRLTEKEREPLKTDLFLSPSALLAVLIVRFHIVVTWL